jgi:hypothetical protein
MDMSMLYIGAVIVVLVIGFVFAMRIGLAAAAETDRAWPSVQLEGSVTAANEAVAPERVAVARAELAELEQGLLA